MLGGIISTSHLFLQKSRLQSPNNIFFKEAMATKNVASQALKKNTRSLSLSDAAKLAPSPKDRCME